MPEYAFNTQLSPAAPQSSMGDMLNLARGVQAYQQAQSLNPLAVQRAQQELYRLQQLTPQEVKRATAEANVSAETEKPRIAAQLAKTGQEQTAEQKAELGLKQEKYLAAAKIVGASATDDRFVNLVKNKNISGIVEYLDDLRPELEKVGLDRAEAVSSLAQLINQAHKNPDALIPALTTLSKRALSPSEAVGLVTPRLSTNVAGQAIAANPVTGQFDVMGTPQTNPMGTRTQTFTDPVTGNIVQAPITPQGLLGAPSNLMGGATAPGVAPQAQPSGPQAVPTGSTADTERARATQAINSYVGSVNALTDASKPGHIPTQEFIAKKLLTYLKDPSVNTGPIADVLAGKSNQATLTSKEQEVLKLIQQRIQNLNPRTDADAQSKKDAYGSFRLKKDALTDLIRQDLGNIQNQKLLANGMMNAAGDPRNPNLPAVNKFQAEYSQYSKDPVLMQYMGIVGTGAKAAIDEHDKEALRKLMRETGLSSLSDLEQKRKQLVEISGVK